MEKPNEVAIKRETLQRVMDYLDTRPHKEVRPLIDDVMANHRRFEERRPRKKKEQPKK